MTGIKIYSVFVMALATILLGGLRAEADSQVTLGTPTDTIFHINPNIPLTDTSIYVGDTVTTSIPGTFSTSGMNSSGAECTASPVDWVWSITSVQFSTDGSAFISIPASTYSSYPITIKGTGDGSTGLLSAKFPTKGYWQISVHVHVDYTSTTCGNSAVGADLNNNAYSVEMGDFGINATMNMNPPIILLGSSGAASVTVTPFAGFDGKVNLSLLGAPTGVTGDVFSVSPVYPNAVQRGYNIYVAETATPGTYPVLIDGVSGILNHAALVSITIPPHTAAISSGFGTTTKNDGNGNPVPNDPTARVDTIINTAKIQEDNDNYIREKSGVYTCTATGFMPGFTYWWQIGGTMGVDTFNSSSDWFAESTANQKVTIMSSYGADVYPQTTTVYCTVRNAGSSYPVNSNTITVNWHWPYENLVSSGLPATPDNNEPLEDVPTADIKNVTDKNYPGYVRANDSITYVIAPVNPLVAWFYDKTETFSDLAGLLSGSEEVEVAFAASKLTTPEKPADITGTASDSSSGSDLAHACSITVQDEKANPANSGDYRVSPPTMANACPDPIADPVGMERFQAKFLHTVKVKTYFTIYHYKGDQYAPSGFSGTKPTDIKEQTGNPLVENYYIFAQY